EMRMRVLLVENAAVGASIEPMLRAEHFLIQKTNLEKSGIDLTTLREFDVVVVSISPPDLSGFDLLRTFRAARIKTPLLVVFDFAAIEGQVQELGFGPSDYVLNPIQKDELAARIHAIVQRARRPAHPVIVVGDLAVNLERRCVEVAGSRVHLTG